MSDGEKTGALAGVRALDLSRLAPGPYCTMQLADMGAEVVVVAGGPGSLPIAAFSRGKTFIQLDLKHEAGRRALLALVESADILVEGYRPGVAKRLGVDFPALEAINPRLIYCSLTGWGQEGPLAQEAGHDINYAALSGALGAIGPAGDVPSFPLNMLADFAGGSLFAVIGILGALYQRERTGRGQYIDVAMVDGCMSLMAMHFADWGEPVLPARGEGLLAGGAPQYRCYRCADDRFVAIGPLERKFFENLWRGLGFEEPVPDQLDRALWPALTRRFEEAFATRSRDAWAAHFAGRDACLAPVLDPAEALAHPHNRARHPFASKNEPVLVPRMRGVLATPPPTDRHDRTSEILAGLGFSSEEITAARGPDAQPAGLPWPPF